ncbi:ATP-binding protein [Cupriavidus basilensis]|uniref:ATP-binding protein n=1 Tax=Cupriavidus basilensis TaxID=68895 RepID=UPI0020A64CA8|nr:ATP-binding protein [Cupriavidus basilensis]MCP3020332.1 putative DNA binding domain-containing protein [Cupriavidus basilensis]
MTELQTCCESNILERPMTEQELHQYLGRLYSTEHAGCEWKEFKSLKSAISGRKGEDLISYVSALANMEGGVLVMGVEDKSLHIVGIQDAAGYTPENLPHRVLGRCTHLMSEGLRVESFATTDTAKSVWVVHVPKHAPRLPVLAHEQAWQRVGDSLVELTPERRDAILREPLAGADWSKELAPGATLDDLDPEALAKVRETFAARPQNQHFADALPGWSLETLLDKAKLTINGKVTRAALLLLGKPESDHLLPRANAQLVWKLEAEERSYEHFGPPFLLTTTELLHCIRNIRFKIFPDNQLLATEVSKYDTRVILEALHNCIAHQDYEMGERVIVTEKLDRLIFENAGGFFEGSVDDYYTGTRTPSRYRNTFLAQAMVNLGMIDTMGYGIHQMFLSQRERFFPLPDYTQSTANKVVLQIYGHVIDENYSKLLLERRDLPLETVILLDRVQKRQPITDDAAQRLKRQKLIEGRKPNYYVSAAVAEATDSRSDYIRNRAFDDAHYKQMILAYLDEYGHASKQDIARLVLDKFSDALDDGQRQNKLRNILYTMAHRDQTIENKRIFDRRVWIRRDAA